MYQISLSIMLVADQTVLSPDQMFCTHPVAISKNGSGRFHYEDRGQSTHSSHYL